MLGNSEYKFSYICKVWLFKDLNAVFFPFPFLETADSDAHQFTPIPFRFPFTSQRSTSIVSNSSSLTSWHLFKSLICRSWELQDRSQSVEMPFANIYWHGKLLWSVSDLLMWYIVIPFDVNFFCLHNHRLLGFVANGECHIWIIEFLRFANSLHTLYHMN